jgi:mycofactocin biosynthesis protein MftB
MECVVSTEAALDPAQPYELHPDVALRIEPFGGLAYHYGNRRLTFLRSPELVRLVRSVAEHESVDACLTTMGVEPERRPVLLEALAALERAGVLRRRVGARPGAVGAGRA